MLVEPTININDLKLCAVKTMTDSQYQTLQKKKQNCMTIQTVGLLFFKALEFQGPLGPMNFLPLQGALVAHFAGLIVNRTNDKCRGTQDYAPDHPEHQSKTIL